MADPASNVPERAAVLTLELPSRPEAVAAARKALVWLNGSLHLLSSARLRDAQLLVSEHVTSALRHADVPGKPVHLSVLATDAVLHIEVRDRGTGFDPTELQPPTAE